ncbi:MAG: acetate--CoA ligase [Betaproteobacteria bacterium]|nr:MAG: acetate--CoA ligase [Betaproteobacteria bacterium]
MLEAETSATTTAVEAIAGYPVGHAVVPNLRDYSAFRSGFSWDAARGDLEGLPGGGLNIAHEAVDRHAAGKRGEHTALRWLGKNGTIQDFSYAKLSALSNRFANVLQHLGVAAGERVYILAGRIPELYIAALGAWKNRSVVCTLFSAFGPEPIRARMALGDARVLITTPALYQRKIVPVLDQLPGLRHVLLAGRSDTDGDIPGALDFAQLLREAGEHFGIAPTDPEDPALLHFTSGTTGTPKGAVHVHQAVVTHHATGKLVLDLHADDIFWCTADPGWVTGTSYGIIAPLTNGVTSIVDEADFDAERWYQILEQHRVSVWYTAPTAIRMLMKMGLAPLAGRKLPALRYLASVGEPLNPEAVRWGVKAFGLPFHDNWWQTETGGIMIANFPALDVRPGSMGKPVPGIDAAIVRHNADGSVIQLDEPGVEGELALRPGWPSMFRGYLNEEERYRKCFAGGWYLTGDLARRDADGYYWFVGRKDDVIKTSGHLIGPFEVESVLLEHPAVAEAGVIGKPDPVALEVVKAFVALKTGYAPGDALKKDIMAHARKRLGAVVAPKEIDFQQSLPKTRSGKIMRRLLKARELGLPEGDVSTLESM